MDAVTRHPAWFGSVMGTGGLALVFTAQGSQWTLTALDIIGAALLLLASALAIGLAPRYVRRLRQPKALADELADPAHGAMLATFPAGLLVLAICWGSIGPIIVPRPIALWTDGALLLLGVLIALPVSIAWATATARSGTALAGVNGGWLLPPVMNLLVPLALVPIIEANARHALSLSVIAAAFLGIGVFLFLFVMSLIVARLALREPAPSAMSPSLWIPLAPSGFLGLALIRLLEAGVRTEIISPAVLPIAVLVAAMGIGFGLWWTLFALVDLHRSHREGGLPFHPGWWGFVFPIAAMALSVAAVGTATGLTWIAIMGAAMAVALTAVWGLVAGRALRVIWR